MNAPTSRNYKSLFWGTKSASNWNQAVSVMTPPPLYRPGIPMDSGSFCIFFNIFQHPCKFLFIFSTRSATLLTTDGSKTINRLSITNKEDVYELFN